MRDEQDSGELADRRLIQGLLRGDGEALRVLDGWVEVVLRESGNELRAEREDILQEVRIRVYRNLSRGLFDGRSSLRTYAHRIAKNTCIDLARRLWRRSPHAAATATAT